MMKKRIVQSIFTCLITLTFFWQLVGSAQVLPLEEVKAGMRGKGRSVFIDDKIEEFDVEILGVLRNFQPKKNLILAKLRGPAVDEAGVIQGMSGSPVYLNGRLIGAVAYSLANFAKEAIAGITPIEEMMSASKTKAAKSSFSPRIPVKKHLTTEELFDINKSFFRSLSPTLFEGKSLKPLNIPLVFNGFSSQSFEKAKPFFSKLGFKPIKSGQPVQSLEELSIPDLRLREGDPVSAQLVLGDVSMAATGTVTHVDGNKVLAFGHPLYNLGAVDYAMATAKVITVVPSLATSFKLTTVDKPIGKFSQDRFSGVFGEIGKESQLIPVNVRMLNASGDKKEFKAEIVDNKILTPFLVNVVVSSIMTSEERALGDLSLEMKGDIYLDNGMSVHLEDLFSGNFDASITNLSSLYAAVVYYLTNNEFKDLKIYRIDLDVQVSEEVRFSFLEKVWIDKYDVSPGEVIQGRIYTRNFRGESVFQDLSIPAPLLPSGSEFYLIVADAIAASQFERSQYKTQAFVPRSLNQLIRILSSLRKNNRIYLKVIASKPGLFVKGEEMPNLPPTMKSMFSSTRATSSSPVDLERSTLIHYQLRVPYVFKGSAVIPIKIK